MHRVLSSFVCVLLVLSVANCAKKAPSATPAPAPAAVPVAAAPPPAPPPPPSPAAAPAPVTLTDEEIFSRKTLAELNAERPLGDVFFDLDSDVLRDSARATLQRNSEWLKRWRATEIALEGHCDSRGTAEYNVALGERRAAVVKAYLVSLGVPSGRIQTVSKGKEHPFCFDETEPCWQENRRGHFIITAK